MSLCTSFLPLEVQPKRHGRRWLPQQEDRLPLQEARQLRFAFSAWPSDLAILLATNNSRAASDLLGTSLYSGYCVSRNSTYLPCEYLF